jgi:hypothetical protein
MRAGALVEGGRGSTYRQVRHGRPGPRAPACADAKRSSARPWGGRFIQWSLSNTPWLPALLLGIARPLMAARLPNTFSRFPAATPGHRSRRRRGAVRGGCNIVDSQQFGDVQGSRGTGLLLHAGPLRGALPSAGAVSLEAVFTEVQQRFGMQVQLHALARKPRCCFWSASRDMPESTCCFAGTRTAERRHPRHRLQPPRLRGDGEGFGLQFDHLPLPRERRLP